MSSSTTRSRAQNFVLILSLGILNALTPFAIDMYLPSFPAIAGDLNVAVSQIALTVSVYFIGFAFGQIFYGPLLDRFGRKPPLYAGIAVFVVANVGCMLSRSFESLLFFRFISALGGCSSGVAARTMVRDFFPPRDAAKIFSLLMLILSVSPLLAPSVGSLLVHVVGWRAIFGILAAIGVANILMTLLVLPAGQDPDPSVVLRWRPILRNFQAILKNVQFSTFTIAGALSFTGLFVYVAGSPAIFMEGFHVSARTYGGIFAMLACGMIGGGQISMLLGRRFSPKVIFRAALALQVLVALLFLIATYSDLAGLYGTILFLFLILMTAGITYPNASALAIEPFTKNIGSASALQGFLQLGIGAFTSAAVGLLKTKGALPTAATMSASSLLAGAIMLWTDVFSRRRRVP